MRDGSADAPAREVRNEQMRRGGQSYRRTPGKVQVRVRARVARCCCAVPV